MGQLVPELHFDIHKDTVEIAEINRAKLHAGPGSNVQVWQ